MAIESNQQGFRLAAYWLTVAAFAISWTWFIFDAFEKGRVNYLEPIGEAFLPPVAEEEGVSAWSTYNHAILVMPSLIVATLASFFITTTPLPVYRTNWINYTLSFFRKFKLADAEEGNRIAKENQFLKGAGQLNFNWIAILYIVIPCGVVNLLGWSYAALTTEYLTEAERWWYMALIFGWAGTLGLCFFLIPVTRHSVLLVAMGWSPVHALRIHVVAGWFAWWCIAIHGIMFVVDWFAYQPSVIGSIWPDARCWTWKYPNQAFEGGEEEYSEVCTYPMFNFTGIFAGVFFLVLAASSIHWFRRKNYRLFYILHVTFGSLTLVAIRFHDPGATALLMPSLIYYLASTSPTLVQALASYYRGGHKIVKVVDLGSNGGDCIEVHVETDAMTDAALIREPCSYIKLCVPSISMVWHPFTVFRYSKDPKSVRILFRPVGPFTTQLAAKLLSSPRPIAILDGLYSVGNHAIRAMTHDHVIIVAGGVAISPFLSLIPNLLGCLREVEEGSNTTKKIVLHWACREGSLIEYVRDTYLYPMMVQAKMVSRVTFEVHIHRTGTVPKGYTPGKVTFDSSITLTEKDNIYTREETEEIMDDDEEINVDDPSTWPLPPSSSTDNKLADKDLVDTDVAEEKEQAKVDSSSSSVESGFAMELARMMPGRYSEVCQNLALFCAFTLLIWSGQWIYFHFDVVKAAQQYYNEYLAFWISNLIWLTVVFFGSLLIEGVVLCMRNYWPAPAQQEKDPFVVTSVTEELTAEDNMTTKEPLQYEEHVGRPVPSDLLDEPRRLATAPAIFTCGPVAMTDAVSKEAMVEDSFGLTRFVLYEELFEM